MTAAEICAVSYVILWDALERHTLVTVHAALISRMFGGSAEIPDMGEVRAGFDRALAEEPKRVSPQETVMLRAIGLR